MVQAPPPLSVVMPVHNAEPYLAASIGSILEQSYGDFEFVCLEDASTDRSRVILRQWEAQDPRIRVSCSDQPLGPTAASNRVTALARAPLIARMDADDVSLTERLGRQMAVFADNDQVALVGCLFEGIDEMGSRVRPRDRWRAIRRSPFAPFAHGSTMFTRRHFDAAGGYRETCNYWEDLDLYYRIADLGQVLVLPIVLYRHRFHLDSSRTRDSAELERAVALMRRCMDERRAGRSYEPLLGTGAPVGGSSAALDLEALLMLSSSRLWAGASPGLLTRIDVRRDVGLSARRLAVLAYVIWGDTHPGSLRSFLRMLIRVRDGLVGCWIDDEAPHAWRPVS